MTWIFPSLNLSIQIQDLNSKLLTLLSFNYSIQTWKTLLTVRKTFFFKKNYSVLVWKNIFTGAALTCYLLPWPLGYCNVNLTTPISTRWTFETPELTSKSEEIFEQCLDWYSAWLDRTSYLQDMLAGVRALGWTHSLHLPARDIAGSTRRCPSVNSKQHTFLTWWCPNHILTLMSWITLTRRVQITALVEVDLSLVCTITRF